jgi:hypothetical protein
MWMWRRVLLVRWCWVRVRIEVGVGVGGAVALIVEDPF